MRPIFLTHIRLEKKKDQQKRVLVKLEFDWIAVLHVEEKLHTVSKHIFLFKNSIFVKVLLVN